MKVAVLFAVVLLLVCLQDTSAWFGGGGSKSSGKSSERSFTDRVKDFGRNAVKGVADAGRFASGAVKGGLEMGKAYKDMRQANWKNSDKYFHARGNHDAAKHGPGGKWAAEKISNLREIVDRRIKGDSAAASAADQAANKWGRSGGDPNKYRPKGLPSKY